LRGSDGIMFKLSQLAQIVTGSPIAAGSRRRLNAALSSFFENARSRIDVTVL